MRLSLKAATDAGLFCSMSGIRVDTLTLGLKLDLFVMFWIRNEYVKLSKLAMVLIVLLGTTSLNNICEETFSEMTAVEVP
jgi:hypothetical protein